MEGGRRYDKQGSAYPIRINSEAIHSKDRGRGVKGKERRGKGGGRAAITLNCQVWLQHIKYNHVYRVGYGTLRDTDTYTTYTPPLCHLELLFPPDKSLTWPTLCWVFKDNYKARPNTSPPNIWKEQVRDGRA